MPQTEARAPGRKPRRTFWQNNRILFLRLGFLVMIPVLLVVRPVWGNGQVPGLMDLAGILLIVSGVLGRFWAILYVGGRKDMTVVQDGPYAMCRHPLYLFSTIATAGLGLMLGSVLLALVLAGGAFFILSRTAAHEEIMLRKLYGSAYDEYAARTPRILPAIGQFRTGPRIDVDVHELRNNFFDAVVFLTFIPLARLIVWAREAFDLGMFAIF